MKIIVAVFLICLKEFGFFAEGIWKK